MLFKQSNIQTADLTQRFPPYDRLSIQQLFIKHLLCALPHKDTGLERLREIHSPSRWWALVTTTPAPLPPLPATITIYSSANTGDRSQGLLAADLLCFHPLSSPHAQGHQGGCEAQAQDLSQVRVCSLSSAGLVEIEVSRTPRENHYANWEAEAGTGRACSRCVCSPPTSHRHPQTPGSPQLPPGLGHLPSTKTEQPLPKARLLDTFAKTQGLLPASLLPTMPSL